MDRKMCAHAPTVRGRAVKLAKLMGSLGARTVQRALVLGGENRRTVCAWYHIPTSPHPQICSSRRASAFGIACGIPYHNMI